MSAHLRSDFSTIRGNFDKFFRLSIAATEAEKRAVYSVRYRVFCESLGFEDPDAFADNRETDSFDEHSIHCLVTHRASGIPAGCVRLVTVDASTAMPLERRFNGALDPAIRRKTVHQRGHIAEISRLAVAHPFSARTKKGDRRRPIDETLGFPPCEQQAFPMIGLTLILAATASADLLRRTECFAFIEQSLRKRLNRIGITTTQVGEKVQFNGTRAAYHIDVDDAVRSFPDEIRCYYDSVRGLLADSLHTNSARPFKTYVPSQIPAFTVPSETDVGLA